MKKFHLQLMLVLAGSLVFLTIGVLASYSYFKSPKMPPGLQRSYAPGDDTTFKSIYP